MQIKELSVDIETYCDVDLRKTGVYRYAEDESFEILLLAVSINNAPVIVYDLTKNELPNLILQALMIQSLNGLLTQHLSAFACPIGLKNITLPYLMRTFYPQTLGDVA